jgi:hypothetical protein
MKTFNEVINILKTIYESVTEFAFDNRPEIPEDFTFSESTQKLVDEYKILKTAYYTHPEFNSYKSIKSDEFNQIQSAYWNFDTKYKVENLMETEYLVSLGVGDWTEVDQRGGEGEGDVWYSVKYFPDLDMYIRIDGYYQSFHGTDFDDGWESCSEVKPVEKTIIVYE